MADESSSVDDSLTWDSAYCTSWQSSNSETEETILDCRAIVPEGNEYKIVFISSSSDTDDDWSGNHPTELVETPELEEEFVVHVATTETVAEQHESGTADLLRCEGSDVTPETSQYEAAGKSSLRADSEPDGKALSVDGRIVARCYELRASEPVRVTSPSGCGLRAGRLEAEHNGSCSSSANLELFLSEMDKNVTTLLSQDGSMDGNSVLHKVHLKSSDSQDENVEIDLQKLDQVSWTENSVSSTETCNTGLSTLEKYFTFALETGRSNYHKKQPSVALKKPSPPTETCEKDEPSPDVSNDTSEPTVEAQDMLYHSDSETSVNSDMFSDNEENSSDSSSDEATYIAPASAGIPMYGHMSYSLHTIIEESCEESDRGSRSTTPTNSMPPSELEKYFSLTIGRAMQDQKRASLAVSEDDSIISDSFSETSGSMYSETNEGKKEDIDPAVLAASRLEKYFTFGLLGSGKFCYPDDAEFTDESAGLGSENEDENMSPRIRRNSGSSLNIPLFGDNTISQNNNISHSTEITESAFVQDASYDTVKRKKIKDDSEQEVNKEDSGAFDEDSGLSTVKRKKKDEVSIIVAAEATDDTNSEDVRTENLDIDSRGLKEESISSLNICDKNQVKEPHKEAFSNTSAYSVSEDSAYSHSEDSYLDSISSLFSENVPQLTCNNEVTFDELNTTVLQGVDSNKCDSLANNSYTVDETLETNNNNLNSSQTEISKDLITDDSVKLIKSEIQPLSEGYSDDARHIVNKLVAHFTDGNNTGSAGEFPGWEAFELQIAQLMQTVSPASLSVGDPSGSSCSSSTIGSNNSDYGSDTLESADCTTTDDDEQEQNGRTSALTVNLHPLQRRGSEGSGSGESTDSTISEETVYICKQLVQSLKKMVEATQGDPNKISQEGDGFSQARIYITEQIVALMHTVSASRNGSPVRERKQNDCLTEKSKDIEKLTIHELSPLASELSNCSSDEDIDVIIMPNNGNITEKEDPETRVVPDVLKLDMDLLIVDEGISVDNSDDAQTIGSSSQLCLSESSIDEKQLDSSVSLDTNRCLSDKQNLTGTVIKVHSSESTCLTSSLQSDKAKAFVTNNSVESNKVLIHNLQVENSLFPTVLQNASDNTEGENKDECNLQRSLSDRKKASSESNLLLPDYNSKSTKVLSTKSTGNISDLEVTTSSKATCRDTGYYSLKSSDDSFLSLDESLQSQASSASLSRQKSLASTETILEADEDNCAKQLQVTTVINPKTVSLSSGNIPDTIISATPIKSSTLPSSVRNKVTPSLPPPPSTSRFRPFVSSFFSTSGVLRKLAALRDESPSHRISPRGRFVGRSRVPSGSEDVRYGMGSMPQLCFQEYAESCSGSTYGSDRASSLLLEEDSDTAFIYPSCSQISLSSFGSRSESMSSVYSAAGGGRYGTVTVTGEVLFGLIYNQKIHAMEIYVKECRNLAPVDIKRNRSDPYVKIYLLPDRTKSGKRKTKVRKHTLNPAFDELLRFNISLSDVEQRTLWLSVWHSDMFGRNDFLGEVLLALGHKTFENTGLKWYPLHERLDTLESPFSFKGDLFLALKYVPADLNNKKYKFPGLFAKGSLHILMKEARNLMATRSNGTSDPFCKSYLLPDKSKASKQKTPVVKKASNPKWYHTFIYDNVTLDDLKERCLELTLWDYDKITSNDFLGGVRLGLGTGKSCGKEVEWMDSRCEEVTLWRAMLERPNMWVEGCLLLRPTMQPRRT